MGDPAGVGPELCLRLLSNTDVASRCTPIIFGCATTLRRVADACSLPLTCDVIESAGGFESLDSVAQPAIFDCAANANQDAIHPGTVNATTGQMSFDFVQRAIDAALAKAVAGVVTAPINKEAWQAAGIDYPGHTELFAERAGTDEFCMMMTAPAFSCSLVTTHIGYAEVPLQLSTERILEVTRLTHQALSRTLGRPPKLIALGLNPHAGEHGLFGDHEEERLIEPAVALAKAEGISIEGPIPPDTGFIAWRREQTDGYICMYHDQGLIPFKALNFDTGVNTTLGLPIIRTSVDHGTALDIAWQGKAEVSSLIAAVELAASLTSGSL
jgi:4-hydroxythreonine-4-phosphate dehydrogenase